MIFNKRAYFRSVKIDFNGAFQLFLKIEKMAESDGSINFAEFFYTICREAPISAKRKLPEKYFKLLVREKDAIRFAMQSSLEIKREVLAYMGIEHFVIFADTSKMTSPNVEALIKSIGLESNPSKRLKKLVDANVFVSSSKDYCYALLDASTHFHTPTYVKELEMVRTSYHARGWGNEMQYFSHEEREKDRDALQKLLDFCDNVMSAEDSVKNTSGIDQEALRILVLMHRKKGYVSKEKIVSHTGMNPTKVGIHLRKCLEEMYIRRHPVKEKTDFQITSNGVLAVNRFLEKVIKAIDF